MEYNKDITTRIIRSKIKHECGKCGHTILGVGPCVNLAISNDEGAESKKRLYMPVQLIICTYCSNTSMYTIGSLNTSSNKSTYIPIWEVLILAAGTILINIIVNLLMKQYLWI
jgi:hypothetical protein